MEQRMDVARPVEDPLEVSGDDPMEYEYDKNIRRSSLGGDSVLDQDFSDEVEVDGGSLTPLETVLGAQYADDIFTNRKAAETHYHVENCMANQPQVTQHMRCTLIHWLQKVNQQLHFGSETLFVAVSLCDRFLATTSLAQDCLQLLGLCSLLVAAKMEENVLPRVSELARICGASYKHHHFTRMEVLLLSKLEFALYCPTSWYFLNHLALKATQHGTMDRRVLGVARYVTETCIGSYAVTQHRASVQAAAALTASLTLLPCPDLSTTLHTLLTDLYTEDERKDIRFCSFLMTQYMKPFLEPLGLDHAHHHPPDPPSDPTHAPGSPTPSETPQDLRACGGGGV
ncbi:G2/mitotic-specific cyclin S13-7-like [Portunus trituberculatus]|uniref:G2/mitotic-specific cyclin S13-7-like n=1 Tax=Portunus trituberculatus TaxID=210409 RepID=UPI001E1CE851|nr:G2/mitotic-specific cyclin S13-7-like [Portunus trituberculatus]